MKLSRFEDMLATYGAAPERWPEAAAAQRLLAQSPEARAALAAARRVDGALDRYAPRIDPAMTARLRDTVQRRVARMPAPEPARDLGLGLLGAWGARHFVLNLSLRCGALVAMAAVGVWIGWSQPMASNLDQGSADPLAAIQVYPVSDDSP